MASVIDETNNKYGRLLVIHRIKNPMGDGAKWLCKCDCGNEHKPLGRHLRSGHIKSCGCYKNEYARERRLKNLVGDVYGRLTVIKISGYDEKGKSH